MLPHYVIVLTENDPVARGVDALLGVRPAVGENVEGVPLRALNERVWTVKRAGPHVHDERLDRHLPSTLQEARVPLVFPSIHRSGQGRSCFTTHPLGNLGPTSELGGRARTVAPTAPRLMAAALRQLAELGPTVGLTATYEATHHGPELAVPAFFVELLGGSPPDRPAPEHLQALATILGEFEEDPRDRVAVGVGGGHYAPHFTDLALKRHWAFGHLLPRHALPELDPTTARQVLDATPGAEGFIFSRAADAELTIFQGLAARLREADAAERSPTA
jgi:D-aminoacyl-tRNA deacylase